MTISDVLQLNEALIKIKNKDLPFKTAYQLTKLYKFVEENRIFYIETLNNIVNKYGEKDEDGNLILLPNNSGVKIQAELIEQAQKEMVELMDVSVTNIPTIKLNPDDFEELELNLAEMNYLIDFFE